MVSRLPEEERGPAAEALGAVAAADPADRGALRTRMLAQLANTLPSGSSKLSALVGALRFAEAAGTTDLLRPAWEGRAQDFVEGLGGSPQEQRELFVALAGQFASPCRGSYECLLLALRAGGEGARDSEELTAQAVVEFLKAEGLYSCDLGYGKALDGLRAAGSKHADLLALLEIFTAGSFADFKAFRAAKAGRLEALGLQADAAEDKMRVMALAGLAASSEGTRLAYSQVEAALQVGEAEVEGWIVKAIGAGVLEGRMDQMQQVLHVQRATKRTFGAQDWEEVSARLGGFRKSLASISTQMAHA